MNNSKLTATVNGAAGEAIDIGGGKIGAGLLLAGGASRKERLRALRSLLESLAAGRSADELEIRAFGRQTILKMLPDIPNVKADVETDNAPLDAMGFFAPEMERRQGLFARAGVGSLDEYGEKTGEKLPVVVLVVEAVCSADDMPLVEGMRPALVSARDVGIHVVFASKGGDEGESMAERLVDALAPMRVVRLGGGKASVEQSGTEKGLTGDYGYVVCRVMPKGNESARVFALAKGYSKVGFSWVSSVKHCTWFNSRSEAEYAMQAATPISTSRAKATTKMFVSEVCLRT